MRTAAQKYIDAGLSIIPCDKLKGPLGEWTPNIARVLQLSEMAYGFGRPEFAKIGMICGAVSGGVEVIDIDTKYDLTGTLYADYKKAINAEAPGLLKKLVVQQTVSGGYHFIYRCSKIEGNKKLASRPATETELKVKKEKQKSFLETRGEGGFIVVDPSEGYKVIYGDLLNIQEITPAERDTLITVAHEFDLIVPAVIPIRKNQLNGQAKFGLSPFEDYNDRGDIVSLLERSGWSIKKQNAKNIFFLRPGGEGKWSATYAHELKIFYCFTSSSEFEVNKGYNHSQVLTILNFNGDYSACSKWLLSEGYGEKTGRPDQLKAPKKEFSKALEFLASEQEMNDYIARVRNNTFQMGKPTGINKLDEYLLFKPAQLTICNGHDNVGKSLVSWYLDVLSALFHGWKHGIASAENKIGGIKKKIMELYTGVPVKEMTDRQFTMAEAFFKKHFFLVANDDLYSPEDVLAMARVLVEVHGINQFLIDPYNSLIREATNFHEYDYKAVSEMRLFTKQTGCGIFVNCHAVTESLRKVYGKESPLMGYPMPPGKADTEGGGKFSNKADDFITVHRLVEHPEQWPVTEIYVRKVKETETGGRPTPYQNPVKLLMNKNGCGFTETTQGQDPIKEYWFKLQHPDQVQISLPPNTSFDTEPQRIAEPRVIDNEDPF